MALWITESTVMLMVGSLELAFDALINDLEITNPDTGHDCVADIFQRLHELWYTRSRTEYTE